MKKAIGTLALVLVVGMAWVYAGEETDAPWFDMENCSMCKNYSSDGLMDHMSWESYNISNGFISVSTVEADFMEKFREALVNGKALGEKMMAGEEVALCNACTAYGSFITKGAMQEQVETSVGSVGIVTSDDPEVVKEMHAWVERTSDEMAKMHEMMSGQEHGSEQAAD